jgi:hypothetical protein
VESSCELGNEPAGSIKYWETTERLHNLWPLEWYSAPQSWLVSSVIMYNRKCLHTTYDIVICYNGIFALKSI